MNSYDAIIIGAGPAGSTCAKVLAENNLSVLLLDKDNFPRDKPCGGALTPRVLKRFPYVQQIDPMPIFRGFLHSPHFKHSCSIQTPQPLGYMIRRVEFDHALVKLASDQGATFFDGVQISEIKRTANEVEVESNRGRFRGAMVIGADGVNGIVAKKTGLYRQWGSKDLGIALVTEIPYEREVLDEFYPQRPVHVQIWGGGVWGYSWIFAKKAHVNLGVGIQLSDKIEKKIDLKAHLIRYISLVIRKGYLPTPASYTIRGALVPLNRPYVATQSDRVILIGDAVGFVNPLSGEGLYYAMTSGELAAKTVVNLRKNGLDFSERNLKRYQEAWEREFGPEFSKFRSLKWFGKHWSNALIKFAKKDEKWNQVIFNMMLGIKSISRRRMAVRFLWCIIKNIFKKSTSGSILNRTLNNK